MNVQKSYTPGNIKITNVSIINHKNQGVNLRDIMISLEFFEDLMTPFITGKIVISDAISLIEKLPVIGEEMLIVEMSTPGFDDNPLLTRKMVFHVYKVEGNEPVAMKNNVVSLCFASIEAFTDINTRISKTFKGSISTLVNGLIKGQPGLISYKNALVEQTTNNEIYTSNYWTPSQNLYFLAGKALNRYNEPNYVFFENNEGFVFASLNTLYESEPIMYFRNDQKVRRPGDDVTPEEDYMTVLDISSPNFLDYIDRVRTGYYGSSIYTYDVITKRLNFKNFFSATDIKTTKLNAKSAFDDTKIHFNPEAALRTEVYNSILYENSPKVPVDTTSRRMALLTNLFSNKTNIQVFGRLDYTVGRTVELLSYLKGETTAKDTDEELIDKMISGRYLITALSHVITRDSHKCNIELSKDSVLNKFIT